MSFKTITTLGPFMKAQKGKTENNTPQPLLQGAQANKQGMFKSTNSNQLKRDAVRP